MIDMDEDLIANHWRTDVEKAAQLTRDLYAGYQAEMAKGRIGGGKWGDYARAINEQWLYLRDALDDTRPVGGANHRELMRALDGLVKFEQDIIGRMVAESKETN